MLQPSAAVFDLTMVVSGVMILAAILGLSRASDRRAVTIPTALLGLGVLGVGIFPGNTELHPVFALLAFVSGGVAALLCQQGHRIALALRSGGARGDQRC